MTTTSWTWMAALALAVALTGCEQSTARPERTNAPGEPGMRMMDDRPTMEAIHLVGPDGGPAVEPGGGDAGGR
jgi:hypothetical protein